MKSLILSYIPSLLRHVVTSLATVGTLLLTKGLIAPDAVQAVNAGGVSLGVALVAIATPVLSRLVLTGLGKLSPGCVETAGPTAPVWALCMGLGAAAGFGLFLPSCSPAQITAALAIPIHGILRTEHSTIGYDSQTGVAVEVDATSDK